MGFHPPTATARKERTISTAGSTHFLGRRTDRAMVYTTSHSTAATPASMPVMARFTMGLARKAW